VGYEVRIQKWDTNLEGVGHAGAVDFCEDTLLKVKLRAKIEDAFEAA
jgi:hypothetical protein